MRAIIVLLILASTLLAADEPVVTKIGDYTFSIAPANYGMSHELTVLKKDKVLWSLSDFMVRVLNSDSLGIARDVTGDHVPDAIVETFSGGAHCCFAQYIVTLGTKFEVIDTVYNGGRWSDLDNDGLWEVTVNDLTFDYWKLPHSDSPLPEVILEASRTGFVPNAELMLRSTPSASDVLAMLRAARDQKIWKDYNTLAEDEFLPGAMAETHRQFVTLLYAGQGKLGLELIETGWPLFILGREQYVADVLALVKKSPYYPVLRELNAGVVE